MKVRNLLAAINAPIPLRQTGWKNVITYVSDFEAQEVIAGRLGISRKELVSAAMNRRDLSAAQWLALEEFLRVPVFRLRALGKKF